MAQDVIAQFKESQETKDCLQALIGHQEWSHSTDSTKASSDSVASPSIATSGAAMMSIK